MVLFVWIRLGSSDFVYYLGITHPEAISQQKIRSVYFNIRAAMQ